MIQSEQMIAKDWKTRLLGCIEMGEFEALL